MTRSIRPSLSEKVNHSSGHWQGNVVFRKSFFVGCFDGRRSFGWLRLARSLRRSGRGPQRSLIARPGRLLSVLRGLRCPCVR